MAQALRGRRWIAFRRRDGGRRPFPLSGGQPHPGPARETDPAGASDRKLTFPLPARDNPGSQEP